MSIIDEIKERIQIQDLVAETATVRLRKSGANYTGFCPFHTNTHTPSLVVFGGTGTWRCFGTCNEGGDVFDWVIKKNPGYDLKEAIKELAGRTGITLHAEKDDLGERVSAQASANVKKVAQGVFKRWLVGVTERDGTVTRAPDAEALAYALDRGWTLETIKAEGVGFSGHATAAEYKEMRGEFAMHSIELLSPDAVMILGFKGDTAKWAIDHGLDANLFGENYIQGFMETPGLMFAHKFDGVTEYLSSRFLPGWEEKRGRKSHNPNSALAGPKRPYFNSLHRGHHAEGKDKGAIIHIIEGQGCSVTWKQFGAPAMALCGSSWKYLEESGIIDMLKREYDEIAYTTDADTPGQAVVTGKNNDFPVSTAFGALLWVERTPKIEWKRPDGRLKTVKDTNDIAQYFMDAKIEDEKRNTIVKDVTAKAERIVVLAARYAGTQEGKFKEDMVEKVVRPLILSIPDEKRVNYTVALADALYPNVGSKSDRKVEFNKWLTVQKKVAADATKNKEDEDHIQEEETLGGYFRNPADPSKGWLVDMTYDLASQKALLAYRNQEGEIGLAKSLDIYGVRYFPKIDDFVRKGVVVFPSELGPLKSTSELLHIHEDHDRVSVLFDKSTDYAMAAYYQVFSWVYDCFNELPFLRARGGKDTGKSAIMLRIGYLCYRLAKSTGIGSTASLKHAQELYKCTIFFDEMDIADKFDERIVMLNVRAMKDQANVWSMKAVTDINGDQNYEPQAHNVYGPALITMYGAFSDEATDSRCITFDLFGKDIAELKARGIPRRLSAAWHAKALEIRNMSLHWRLKNWKPDMEIPDELEDEMVSTRANQVTVPIKYIVKDDAEALAEITATVREMYADEILEKAQSFEARFLEAIIALTETQRFAILGFVHEAELKEHGHSKYIRYPDMALIVNFLLNEMNTGIEKDVDSIASSPTQEPDKEDKEKDEKGKGRKKGKAEEAGVSAKTVGNVVRKNLRLPVERLGRGYVVIVWSQSKPDEVQNRIDKLRKKFGLDLILEQETNVQKTEKAVVAEEPEMPDDFDQLELYGSIADGQE